MTSPTYPPLPLPCRADGRPRRTGLEIEFAGLDVTQAASAIVATLGGVIEESGPHARIVHRTAIGKVRVELDTALRKPDSGPIREAGLDLLSGVVPVEIVTDPLDMAGLARLDGLVASLRKAGATGSRSGVLLGFGVHLNPETVAPDHPHTLATIRAYALIEHWLRGEEELDPTRRALPFVTPWPAGLTDALAGLHAGRLEDVMRLYAAEVGSRNHGLDLLPLFKHTHPALYADLFGEDDGAARPTFHFRLPDSRIDEPDWSLRRPWRLWQTVERVAADPALLHRLTEARAAHADAWFDGSAAWARKVDDILNEPQRGNVA